MSLRDDLSSLLQSKPLGKGLNESQAESKKSGNVKNLGWHKPNSSGRFNEDMFRIQHIVQAPKSTVMRPEKETHNQSKVSQAKTMHIKSKLSIGDDKDIIGTLTPNLGSLIFKPHFKHMRKASQPLSELPSLKISAEEKNEAMRLLTKLRVKLSDSTDKFPILIKKLLSSILVTSTNHNLTSKASVLEFLGDVSTSISSFSKEAINHEKSMLEIIENCKVKERTLNKKIETLNNQQLVMNSMALELDRAQIMMEEFVTKDEQDDKLQEENKKLVLEIDSIREDFATKFHNQKQEYEVEIQRLKNSFYIVQKLQDTIKKQEELIEDKNKTIEIQNRKIIELDIGLKFAEAKIEKLHNRIQMYKEDLASRTTQALTYREEVKTIKTGIVGILFNREQRESRNKGVQNSIMARSQMIKDYVRQYEDQLLNNIYSYSFIKNTAFDTIPFNKFSHLVEYVSSQATQQGLSKKLQSNVPKKKSDIVVNIILEKTKLNQRNISFADYKLACPSFANLVHHDLFTLSMSDIEEVFNKKFDLIDILGTIRAIFDSYYIELQSHEKLDTCPEFGAFVFLWFDRFELNPETKELVPSTSETEIQKRRRSEFSVKITSPLFQKLWDSYIFNEFISGKFSKDDILFYLNTRWLILMGLEGDTRGRCFDVCQMVPVSQVIQGLNLFLHAESQDELEEFLVYQLIMAVPKTKKAGLEYVDLYQILRICLEEYKYLKIAKYLTLYDSMKDAIDKADSAEKAFSFALFSNFVSSLYPALTTSDIFVLYKRSLNLGRGLFSIEALWVAGEESGCYATVERLGISRKSDYLNRATKDGKGRSSFLLKLLPNQEKEVENILKAHPRLINSDNLEPYECLENIIRRWLQGKVPDEVEESRIKIMRHASSLGCLNYSERYEKMLLSLHETYPKSIHYTMNLGQYLSRLKHLESKIISFKQNSLTLIYGGPAFCFKQIENLIGGNYDELHHLEEVLANKAKHERKKRDRATQIQKNLLAMMDSWYKMVVELLKNRQKVEKALQAQRKLALEVPEQNIGGSSRSIKKESHPASKSVSDKLSRKSALGLASNH